MTTAFTMSSIRTLIHVFTIASLIVVGTPPIIRGQQSTVSPTTVTNTLGMRFAFIPPGEFLMGSPASELGRGKDEGQRLVILTQGFYMQTTEVTRQQWLKVMGRIPPGLQPGGEDLPVSRVTWTQTQRFIYLLNQREKTDVYRLPSEAEWEFACRAGTVTSFSNGGAARAGCDYDAIVDPIGWFAGNSVNRPQAVAQKLPNPWGLYDMHGNVWEWCLDYYARRHTINATDTILTVMDPKGPGTGYGRVFRGGGFNFPAHCSRSANRKWVAEHFKSNNLGFRLVRVP